MAFLNNLVHHPRRLALRRVLFQIHLWGGVLLSVYLVVIALSGSVLVFKDELTRWSLPPMHAFRVETAAEPAGVVAAFQRAHPGWSVASLQAPSPAVPAYLLETRSPENVAQRWVADPVTGATQPSPRNWIDVVHDLHDNLLLPPTLGMQLNAAGAAVLLLLAASGLVLWWSGLRNWARGLRVNLRANWRRINYDLHSAIGFWTLLIVTWWAISGVYFGFYRQVSAAISVVSPIQGMRSPEAAAWPAAPAGSRATLTGVLRAAQAASPRGRLWSVSNPSLSGSECYVLLDLRAPGDFSHRDIVRVRAADARVLSVWHYGERHTLGDWVLWSMHPVHFGTVWGFPAKVLWALLGLSLAVLTGTGVVMYWNRFLRHRLGP